MEDFHFEDEFSAIQQDYNDLNPMYSMQIPQSSTTTLTQVQLRQVPQAENPFINSNTTWSTEQAHMSNFAFYATPGCNTFGPERGSPYFINEDRQKYLDAGQPQLVEFHGQNSVTVNAESEDENWVEPSYPSSYAPSQDSPQPVGSPQSYGSPQSQGSPQSHSSPPLQAASPLQIVMEQRHHHQHVFSSMTGIGNTNATKGRQRNLTNEEKKHARDVRFAKACWACHLSKTKVSVPGR